MKGRTMTSRFNITTLIICLGTLPLHAQQHKPAPMSGSIVTISSTIPPDGDINPYGVFRVPRTVGNLTRGNILVSNFNNSANLQGTGTTIVQDLSDRLVQRLCAN